MDFFILSEGCVLHYFQYNGSRIYCLVVNLSPNFLFFSARLFRVGVPCTACTWWALRWERLKEASHLRTVWTHKQEPRHAIRNWGVPSFVTLPTLFNNTRIILYQVFNAYFFGTEWGVRTPCLFFWCQYQKNTFLVTPFVALWEEGLRHALITLPHSRGSVPI